MTITAQSAEARERGDDSPALSFSSVLSTILSAGAILLLAASLGMLVLARWRAWKMGWEIPSVWEGNHGPWRHTPALCQPLGAANFYAFSACGLGFLAVLVRASSLQLRVAGICAIALLVLLGTHYWLID